MTGPLKLFVWEDVLCDYTCGMVCVLAHDLEEALEVARAHETLGWAVDDFGGHPYRVVVEPEAFIKYGGG